MFYIFNCKGEIVGNPKGYRTPKGANQQCERKGSRIKALLWSTYYQHEAATPEADKLVYRISGLD